MKEETLSHGLTAAFGDAAPALMGVQASGRLDGPILQMRWRQRYRNPHAVALEVIYTFPLPIGAALLEFASELQGKRQVAAVVAREKGEAQYEEALEKGDAPVLLESRPDGLHTANIGNLKPGEEITLEIRWAMALAPEQGRLRIAFPSTIAPRFGNPAVAGLQPQQVPVASLTAGYSLELSLVLGAGHAGAQVDCPTHRTKPIEVDGASGLELEGSAWLDRDVVFLVTPREAQRSMLLLGENPFDASAPVVALAAFVPPAQPPRERIVAKLLVDCSGSMGGDSIASAVRALRGGLDALRGADEVSLSCFGSEVQHRLALGPLTAARRQRLAAGVADIRADLGGTEMESALAAVYRLGTGSVEDGLRDVLLVTDGEVWQADAMIEAARASGHRIFAIGVGSAPAEGVLRKLAEATGGACEFATPGEALETAAVRMLQRMRCKPWRELSVQWDEAKPKWQTELPAGAFGGDAVLVYAGFAPGAARQRVVRLAGLGGRADEGVGRDTPLPLIEARAVSSPIAGDTLARLSAAHRLGRIAYTERDETLALALSYQIPCAHTVSVLVHERAAEDKVRGAAQLHRVPSMLAAGHGASATVTRSLAAAAAAPPVAFAGGFADAFADVDFAAGPFGGSGGPSPLPPPAAVTCSPSTRYGGAGTSRPCVDPMLPPSQPWLPQGPETFEELARAAAALARDGRLKELPTLLARLSFVLPAFNGAVQELRRAQIDDTLFVVLIAHWLNTRAQGLADPQIEAALAPHLQQVDAGEMAMCLDCFERRLAMFVPAYPALELHAPAAPAAPTPTPAAGSRARRLAAALGLGRRQP